MTLHQPWHDGVGRRVGKRLRHIRKPKKPPDPGGKKSMKKHQPKRRSTQSQEEGKHPVSMDGYVRLLKYHSGGRIIRGRRYVNCGERHVDKRALDRERFYSPCGMSRRRTKLFYQRKMRERQYKATPPAPIQTEQVLPPQSNPRSLMHPVCSNINSSHHGIAAIAVVVALIVRKLIQQRRSPTINTQTTAHQMKSSTMSARLKSSNMSARGQTSKSTRSWPVRKMFLFFAFTLCTHLCTRGVNTGHHYKPFLLQHSTMEKQAAAEQQGVKIITEGTPSPIEETPVATTGAAAATRIEELLRWFQGNSQVLQEGGKAPSA